MAVSRKTMTHVVIIKKSLNYLPDRFSFNSVKRQRFVVFFVLFFFFESVCWAFCPEVSLVCFFIHGFSGVG